MRIKRRWLSMSIICLLLLSFLFAFAWLNSEVSYKYEVQDSIASGQVLDEHQNDILYWITSSKIEFICSAVLLVVVFVIKIVEPKFGGKLSYYSQVDGD